VKNFSSRDHEKYSSILKGRTRRKNSLRVKNPKPPAGGRSSRGTERQRGLDILNISRIVVLVGKAKNNLGRLRRTGRKGEKPPETKGGFVS